MTNVFCTNDVFFFNITFTLFYSENICYLQDSESYPTIVHRSTTPPVRMDVKLTYVTGALGSGAVVCGCFAGRAASARLVAGVGLVATLGTRKTRVSPEVLARHTPHYNTNNNLYCQDVKITAQ